MFRADNLLTGIVDKDVEATLTVLHHFKSLFDGFITVQVDLEQFDGIGYSRAFRPNLLQRRLTLLGGSASKKDVIGIRRLEECLDSFVSNAVGGTGYENDLGCHCVV